MKKTARATELSRAVSARFGLEALECADWSELKLFGGIGMDRSTFCAIANAAIEHGDKQAAIYELETIRMEFEPVSIELDFHSFNLLKGNAISHFDVAMIPPSRAWAALLTNELETVVYGTSLFLSAITRHLPPDTGGVGRT